jgi:methylmalonyl-CoA mutase N-terminal domain/subunit
LTAQQPYNNVVRTALQAMAGVLGGTQSLHTNSLDEALALPTEEAATLALRTQQIIAHETGVANVVDPLGGSYFVEKLTSDLEEEALAYFDTIDRMGGMVPAIENGYPQREIAESAYKFQQAVEQRDKIIVGVNEFASVETGRLASCTSTRPPPTGSWPSSIGCGRRATMAACVPPSTRSRRALAGPPTPCRCWWRPSGRTRR